MAKSVAILKMWHGDIAGSKTQCSYKAVRKKIIAVFLLNCIPFQNPLSILELRETFPDKSCENIPRFADRLN